MYYFCFFFFSSRRRHTRLTCDWSSDVCSSDLIQWGWSTSFTNGVGTLTYLCKKHKVPTPFVKLVDQPHWIDGGCGGYYVPKIGRASCRERGEISVVAVAVKKNIHRT